MRAAEYKQTNKQIDVELFHLDICRSAWLPVRDSGDALPNPQTTVKLSSGLFQSLPMARPARFVVPDLPHHVTQRGNRREKVFFGDDDYALYHDLLASQRRAASRASRCGPIA
ncbi:MAG TPA: hypothetical protein VJY34_07830 [Roseiarcus sp.]|nr:hypothetical protein [Roseiarcus sp.]